MSAAATCSKCGTAIPPHAKGGQCPRCLLHLAKTGGAHGGEGLAEWGATEKRIFGEYELIEEIARGGMGVVYRARQASLGREVAVKMILAGELAGEDSLRMFRREAQAAANLHHPNIVPVYEIGEQDFQQYFTMRLVPGGRTIADWASTQRGNWRALASAAAQAARAVDHAHTRGVLHRDLKPSNILWDGLAGPQVTDFGLAKLLDDTSGATRTVEAIGSPSYMAPEQMGGRTREITTATDVYGLGAVLYELISGKPPFLGATPLETMKRAAEELPAPLTAPRDLRTVCLKCLAKAPEDRYASAAALAEDLERFARGEPVSAVPLTPWQTAWRWARRRPEIAALIALSTLCLVAGIAGILWQWRKAELARRGESAALAKATSTVIDLYTHSGLSAAKDGDTTRAALWFAKAAEAATGVKVRQENLARQVAWRNDSPTPVRAFESKLGNILRLYWNRSQTALLGFTWDLKGTVWNVESESQWEPAPGFEINNAVWANRADWIICGSTGWVRCLEYPSGHERARMPWTGSYPALALTSGDRLAAVGGEKPFLWDLETQKTAPLPSTPVRARTLQFSPNGHWLMIYASNRVGICSTAEPDRFVFPPVECLETAFPGFLGNDQFFTAREDGIVVLRTGTGSVVERYPSSVGKAEAFPYLGSADGRFIVTSMAPVVDRTVGFTQFPVHGNRIEQAAFSMDGSLLATACYDSVVRLVNLPSGTPVRQIGWHQEGAMGVAISPDNRFIASSQGGGDLVRVWRLGGPPVPQEVHTGGHSSFRLSRDERLLLSTGTTLSFVQRAHSQVYSVETAQPAGSKLTPGGAIIDGDFAPDASWVVLVSSSVPDRAQHSYATDAGSGALHFWDWKAGQQLGGAIRLPAEPRGVAVHPSGRWVAVYTARRDLIEIEVASRAVKFICTGSSGFPAGDVYPNGRCRYSPDGRFIAAWAMRMPALLWDRQDGRFIPGQVNSTNHVTDVDFAAGFMSSVSVQSSIDILHLPAAAFARPALQDIDWLFVGRFNLDAGLLLTGGRGKIAHVWNWREGTLNAPAFRHDSEIFGGAFIPKTECAATGGLDQKIAIWNRKTGLPVRPPLQTGIEVLNLAATSDGRKLICGDGRILIYSVEELLPKPALSLSDSLLLAEIDAAAEIRNGGLEPLNASEWLKKWRKFRSLHPAWHRYFSAMQ